MRFRFVPVPNFYEKYFRQQLTVQVPLHAAAEATASAYLDGKLKFRGKYKVTSAERDADFWSSPFLEELPSEAWRSDLMLLALARYFAQERIANVDLLAHRR